jgi:gamma-tubulin complex component 2
LDHLFKTKELSLQKLWFQIQPTAKTMDVLDKLCMDSISLKGGALLNHIHDKSVNMGGDLQAQNLFKFIMERATVPYFELLQSWVYRGDLSDLYSEFLVQGNPRIEKTQLASHYLTGDDYWAERYTLRDDVPVFLEQYKARILVTGKYLNVVRECGRDVRYNGGTISFGVNYGEWIDKAHEYACTQVMQLIMEENSLIDRLKSIKHYYLLDRGDFMVHFLDSADTELEKTSVEASLDKLRSLLEMSIKMSSVNNDPFQNDVTCVLRDHKLIDHLGMMEYLKKNIRAPQEPQSMTAITAREAFSLDYKVSYPLSLVLNRKHLVKYELLFRHLFNCKCVERSLCGAWLRHKFTKELNLGTALQSLYALRSRMLHFVQNFTYYMMVEVIDKNFHIMIEKMRTSKTLEEIMKAHENFLDTCLTSCLIADRNIKTFTTLCKLLSTCGVFAKYMNQFTSTLTIDDVAHYDNDVFRHRKQRIQLLSQNAQRSVDENFTANIEKFERNFMMHFVQLMEGMKKTSQTGGVNFDYLFSAFVNTIIKL